MIIFYKIIIIQNYKPLQYDYFKYVLKYQEKAEEEYMFKPIKSKKILLLSRT